MSVLDYFNIDVLVGVAGFAAGVALSQRIKDFIKGVPSEVRSAASSFESSALTALTDAKNKALADLKAALPGGTVTKPVAPAVQAAPAAPAPVSNSAAPAAPAPAPAAPQA